MSKPLTTRQKSVYEFIESYILQKGYGPTVREIAEAVHLSSPSTVHVHLKTLEEKGYIVRDPLKSRSISPRSPAQAPQKMQRVNCAWRLPRLATRFRPDNTTDHLAEDAD